MPCQLLGVGDRINEKCCSRCRSLRCHETAARRRPGGGRAGKISSVITIYHSAFVDVAHRIKKVDQPLFPP